MSLLILLVWAAGLRSRVRRRPLFSSLHHSPLSRTCMHAHTHTLLLPDPLLSLFGQLLKLGLFKSKALFCMLCFYHTHTYNRPFHPYPILLSSDRTISQILGCLILVWATIYLIALFVSESNEFQSCFIISNKQIKQYSEIYLLFQVRISRNFFILYLVRVQIRKKV